MNKKQSNFITSLVAAVTICSIIGATPVEAKSMVDKPGAEDYKNGVTGQQVYDLGGMNNKDGTIAQGTAQANVKYNYLSGKLDSWSEASIIDAFKSAGLTESDFYALKAQREVTSSSNVTVNYGWARNSDGKWYYSEDGHLWVVSAWKLVNGVWYYFDSSGQAVTGWKQIDGAWYYFNSSCAMVSNTTIDGYTLGSDGKLIQ